MRTTAQTGLLGEHAATDYLRQHGFQIEALNWRTGHYELDIVAQHMGVLHFVEVKTRQHHALTSPEDAITPQKFRALSRAAQAYLSRSRWSGECQFDLAAVEITPDGICSVELVENAMEYNW